MKLMTLAFIAAFTLSAVAQNNSRNEETSAANPNDMNRQIGCPVAFTNVALKNNARFMPVRDAAPDNSLAFQYKNQSGKKIESIEVRVALAVKKSIYDLDATTLTRDVTLTGDTAAIMPLNLIVYSLGKVTLQQVNYEDGKVWTPKPTNNCNYQKINPLEGIAK